MDNTYKMIAEINTIEFNGTVTLEILFGPKKVGAIQVNKDWMKTKIAYPTMVMMYLLLLNFV